MVRRKLLFKDKAGNKLFLDPNGRLAVRNKQGKIVNPSDTRNFLRRKKVKEVIEKQFGGDVKIKILKPIKKRKWR